MNKNIIYIGRLLKDDSIKVSKNRFKCTHYLVIDEKDGVDENEVKRRIKYYSRVLEKVYTIAGDYIYNLIISISNRGGEMTIGEFFSMKKSEEELGINNDYSRRYGGDEYEKHHKN